MVNGELNSPGEVERGVSARNPQDILIPESPHKGKPKDTQHPAFQIAGFPKRTFMAIPTPRGTRKGSTQSRDRQARSTLGMLQVDSKIYRKINGSNSVKYRRQTRHS